MSIIGEIVVETVGAAVEIATDSRSRRVRWAAYGILFLIVALIIAAFVWAFSG